jgi:tRNA A-37 threonylcarbamoyl transferase component Bud32
MNANILRRVICFTRGTVQKQDPEELLSKIQTATESPIQVIKDITNPGEIKRTLKVNIVPWGTLCLHEYVWNPRRIALSPFRLSRVERTWNFYDEIMRNHVIVPEPVMLLEIKKSIFTVKTYLATRWIDGGFSLHRLALKKDIPYSFDFQTILSMCVDTLAKLHTSGFIHGDLKWSNLHYVQNRDSHIELTDLDALKKTSSPWLQGRDFARFLIIPKKYLIKKETIEILMERYLKARDSARSALEKAIRSYMVQKTRALSR